MIAGFGMGVKGGVNGADALVHGDAARGGNDLARQGRVGAVVRAAALVGRAFEDADVFDVRGDEALLFVLEDGGVEGVGAGGQPATPPNVARAPL